MVFCWGLPADLTAGQEIVRITASGKLMIMVDHKSISQLQESCKKYNSKRLPVYGISQQQAVLFFGLPSYRGCCEQWNLWGNTHFGCKACWKAGHLREEASGRYSIMMDLGCCNDKIGKSGRNLGKPLIQ